MRKNELKAIMLALGISASSLALTGCGSEKEDTIMFKTILEDCKDSTSTDEILSLEENKRLVDDFYTLDKYLSLSEKLHSLDLESVVTKGKLDSTIGLLSIDDLQQRIIELECKERIDGQYKNDAEVLLVNEGHINKWLAENGSSTTLKMAALVAKAKILDALGLPMEEYKRINILENPEDYYRIFSLVEVKYTNSNNNEYYYALGYDDNGNENLISNCIRIVDENRKKEKEKPTKNKYGFVAYDNSRNEKLYEDSQIIKQVMYATYRVEDDSIEQEVDNAAVEKNYKEKVKSLK